MCGIAGIAFADVNRQADTKVLERMTRILRHRGPDSEGFHFNDGIGLGVRRLSIIDTLTGDQPIANEDGSVVVVCNGEIYNYVELRRELQKRGHRFRTQSDVEVIAHLYEEHPDRFLDQLRGMFALAIWDARRRRLLVARDRLGIKPLHYAITNQGLVFGSELKAILASAFVTPSRDPAAMRDLLTFGFVRSPHTMFKEVKRLLPGQSLLFDAGKISLQTYWDVSFPARHEYNSRLSINDCADELREKLTESVRLHLRSDVPVGTWLSGGIDSSAIAALMSREHRSPVHSFTLGFEDRAADEIKGKRLLDEYPEYNLIGHRTECNANHVELLPRAVWHREQPFGLGVDISQMLIAEMTSKHVKVVLTGEGSDENFGGYPWYHAQKILKPVQVLPRFARNIAAFCLATLARSPGAAHILRSPAGMNAERFGALIGHAPLRSKFFLLSDELAADIREGWSDITLLPFPDAFDTWHPFAQLQYADMKLRLADLVIPHLDLLSMSHGLEARVPFLDHPFVEFCATIPPRFKMRRLQEKFILRYAMKEILPREIRLRKKFGLSAPTRDWINRALPEWSHSLLSAQELNARGWFKPSSISNLIRQHQSGETDHSRLLLMVLTTQLWDELFMTNFSGEIACATA